VNLASIIESHPAESPALVSRADVTSYGQLRDQTERLRGGLVGLGIQPGDRVAICCANNWYFVVSYLAVVGIGAIAVPLNPTSPAPELQHELTVVGAKAVIAGPSGRHGVSGLDRAALPELEAVVAAAGHGLADAVDLEQLLAAGPAPIVDREPGDLAALVFTSGTAGRPKAAMLSHRNLLSNIAQLNAEPSRAIRADEVVLVVLPLFHIFGLTVGIGAALANGGSVVLVERFDPSSALETVGRHGVTIIPGAPAMWAAWANLPDAPPDALASVRLALSGSDKLPAAVAEAVEARFGVVVHEGYGLTEAAPVVTTSVGDQPRYGSIGVPLPGVEVRLVDAGGDDALIDDPGELWVRGPNVFQGYWDDPEATAAVLTDDGWLRTGDLAVVSDDGHLTLVDRMKDLIIVSGFNVYPGEVEDVLIAHPGVDACAVVGVPHPYSGESVKAYVVGAPGVALEEDDLIAWCGQHLARYKCPEKVMFVTELPKGLSGKVLRSALD
jgi:long-chain acyl-CoA synthetase